MRQSPRSIDFVDLEPFGQPKSFGKVSGDNDVDPLRLPFSLPISLRYPHRPVIRRVITGLSPCVRLPQETASPVPDSKRRVTCTSDYPIITDLRCSLGV